MTKMTNNMQLITVNLNVVPGDRFPLEQSNGRNATQASMHA